jgi:glycosyltransferase involved in cell wall biosynthesis
MRGVELKVSVVVPVLYGERQLRPTLAGLHSLDDELLDLEVLVIVDVPDLDRESEARAENDTAAAEFGARVVYRVGERGFGSALRRGFAEATGDVVIPIMADASEDPRDVLRLVAAIEEGWDVVAGSRYMNGGGIVGRTLKQRTSHLYSLLCRLAGGPRIHDVSNAFKAYRRPVLESVSSVADSFDISVELTVKAHLAGFRVGEVPTVWTNRREGRSNFSMRTEVRNYGRWLLLTLRRAGHEASPTSTPPPSPSVTR